MTPKEIDMLIGVSLAGFFIGMFFMSWLCEVAISDNSEDCGHDSRKA